MNTDVLLYSPDNADFYATRTRSYVGVLSGDFQRKYRMRFEEYYSGQVGTFDFERDVIIFDGQVYTFFEAVSPDEYWPLPEVREPEFLARIVDTWLMLYVSASRFDPSPERVKVFFGSDAEGYEPVAIKDVRRHRGELTSIETNYGLMRLRPIDADTDWKPRWDANDLEPLDLSDFDIQEVHGGTVTIAPRS